MANKLRNKTGSVLGQYSKGNEFSLSLNFGVSGGRMCSKKCIHHPNSSDKGAPKDCYAARSERRFDRKEVA